AMPKALEALTPSWLASSCLERKSATRCASARVKGGSSAETGLETRSASVAAAHALPTQQSTARVGTAPERRDALSGERTDRFMRLTEFGLDSTSSQRT